jgi:RND family efflux transporter MFP subunit
VPFLKEQQWRTQFATAWVREGTLAESVKGPAHVKPASGGEVVLTAGVDATIAPSPWPHTGLDVAASATVFRLVPRVGDRSLPELRADASSLEGEADVARRRVERLTELLQVEGTSQAELERARATLTSLEARLAGARGGVAAASNAAGSESPAAIPVRAPWAGRVAEVSVSPGQTVAAGAQLGRLVKARPLWIVVALRPEQATQVQTTPQGLFLKRPGQEAPVEIAAKGVRLISRSPEVDARTASVNVILEVDRSASELPLGSAVEAELLLAGEKRGIVVPLSALLDDSGTTVAYVQLEGESFARREVRVLGRLGSEALVEGLRPGERLVTQGAGAVRRSSLLSAGAPEGHVH